MKVVVSDYLEPDLNWEKEQFDKMNLESEFYQLKHEPVKKLIEKIHDADILIVNMSKIDKQVVSHLEKCKLIIRHGAGYDNIDVKAASDLGITVSYIPDYCADEVAEQAVMLLLTSYRKFVNQLKSFESSVLKGKWDYSEVMPLRRFSGKKAGIIGCGRIGQKVLNVLRSFGMEISVYDPFLSIEKQKEYKITTKSLEEVLTNSDVITIHSSLDSTTYHLIGEKELRLMKPESIIVNTARGGIIDTIALAKACKEKWIAGAAIDVYENEPPEKNFPLIGLDNVILTPHLSWYSEDAGWDIRKKIVEDISRFIKGEKPRFPVIS